jgi:hypothetical protein
VCPEDVVTVVVVTVVTVVVVTVVVVTVVVVIAVASAVGGCCNCNPQHSHPELAERAWQGSRERAWMAWHCVNR